MKISLLHKLKIDLLFLVTYVLLSFIFLSFSTGGFVINFNSIGFSVISGIEKGFYSFTSFINNSVSAISELNDLKQKYLEATIKLSDYELLQRANADFKKENEVLKSLLNFSEGLTIHNIPAEIIGKDPNNLFSGIILNKGSKHGVKKHMPVITFQEGNTGLVGKIVQVGRETSLIMPIYDYHYFVSARLDINRSEGLINGQGNEENKLIMKYLKKSIKDDIQLGDLVVTSGENYNYPKNIPIGFVSNISSLSYETSLDLEIEPLIDFSKLEYVFILSLTNIPSE